VAAAAAAAADIRSERMGTGDGEAKSETATAERAAVSCFTHAASGRAYVRLRRVPRFAAGYHTAAAAAWPAMHEW
jgi:hypothetical protein